VAKDPWYINELIGYGIWYYGKNKDYGAEDIARQIMYDLYRHEDRIYKDLHSLLNKYIKAGEITLEEDYNGFDGTNFDPDTSEIIGLFYEDKALYNLCLEHYRLHEAANGKDGLRIIPNPALHTRQAREVLSFQQQQEQLHGPQPMPSISTMIAFGFRDNPKEIELFLADAAIRSIIGRYHWKRTSKQAIVSRMIGAKSNQALDYLLNNDPALKAIYLQYIGRYQFDKLMTRLLIGKFITAKISRRGALYVSNSLDMEQLGNAIINLDNVRKFKQAEIEQRRRINNNIMSNIIKQPVPESVTDISGDVTQHNAPSKCLQSPFKLSAEHAPHFDKTSAELQQ
jgi:hypothetical protein